MPNTKDPAARKAASRINELILELWVASDRQAPRYEGFDLTSQQHSVLAIVATNEESTPLALAEALGVSKGAISQHLGVLEKGGYIRRRKSEHDGRVTILELGPKGRKYRDVMRRYEEFAVDRYLTAFAPADIAEIIAALTKLKGAFEGQGSPKPR